MKTMKPDQQLDHHEIYPALPWYVNDSISDAERLKINDHLVNCLTCRVEVEQLKQLSNLVIRSNQDELSGHPAFARLRSQITHHPQTKASVQGWLAQRIQHIEHTMLKPGLLAIATVIVVTLTWFVFNNQPVPDIGQKPGYHTLSSQTADVMQTTDIRVVFSENTRPTAIQQLLATIGAEIVSGPSVNRAYRVRLTLNNHNQHQLAVLQRLRTNPHVLLAEPAITTLLNNPAASQ
ncbi:MAG: hypothetical protein K0U68_06765 [Gammaproteobacteria bacterium]|nr:hypothetical protein [Gammaproteobacteria bacterium]